VAAPGAPSVTAPASTSSASVALRGAGPGASLVVVQAGGEANVTGRVLPDGSFCLDVPLADGANTLRVFTLDQGKMSAPTVVNITRDASAPASTAPACAPPTDPGHSCSDPQSMCDPACNGCKDDAYQPNQFSMQAPALNMKATFDNLQLCPCLSDWFTFVAYNGQAVGITATYAKANGFDLDVAVFHGADVLPMPGDGAKPMATSTTGTSGSNATRTVTFTAPGGGAYYLRVSAPSGSSGKGSYTLTTK
jgi:hypothetical protein